MPLLNYTTTVSADRTIGEIHKILVTAGARQIMSTYGDGGAAIGIAFAIETTVGQRHYHLPIHAERVEAVLRKQKVDQRFLNAPHAHRVAWRIVKDWLEAQLAIIRTEMVTFDQVMFPYMRSNDGRSVYEFYRDEQLALTAGGQS